MPSPFELELKLSNLLQQCTFKQLKQIHTFIITTPICRSSKIRLRFLRRSTEVSTMENSNLIFSQMGGIYVRDITLWNAMIRGYAYNGPLQKCVSLYNELFQRGLKPNNFTYPYVLKSCLELRWCKIGKKAQCQIIKTGFKSASSVAESLFNLKMVVLGVDRINYAREIFNDMFIRPVELWNQMISGYVNICDVKSARRVFDGMPERDVVCWNSMISGYVRVGDVENARGLFERMPEKNIVSWTSMIGLYASCGDIGLSSKLERYGYMTDLLCRNDLLEEAEDLVKRMPFEAEEENIWKRTGSSNII